MVTSWCGRSDAADGLRQRGREIVESRGAYLAAAFLFSNRRFLIAGRQALIWHSSLTRERKMRRCATESRNLRLGVRLKWSPALL
jgi:hypothetical protein